MLTDSSRSTKYDYNNYSKNSHLIRYEVLNFKNCII
uniref:Uncharacterized protein n=1 Tax=Chondria sp. (in: red algae) TaxID=1982705 RepID=A0A1Z1MCD8_9FLOR|nr:hypothetical protein [Chondria sp. (in: red algae)]